MLSYRTTYALQVLAELSRPESAKSPMTITYLLLKCGMRLGVLSEVLERMSRQGIISTTSSSIELKHDIDNMTLLELVEAMDGQLGYGDSPGFDCQNYQNTGVRLCQRTSEIESNLFDINRELLASHTLGDILGNEESAFASRSE